MSERRQHHRYSVWFPVTLDAGTRSAHAICKDASQHGLRIASNAAIEVGSMVTVTLRVAHDSADKSVVGRIVRIEPSAAAAAAWPYMLAIEFEEPVPELGRFLASQSESPPAA
jgi:hypothetical protein